MAKPIDRAFTVLKSKELADQLAAKIYGRTRTDALADEQCVMCGGPKGEFRDAQSAREYELSGFCQECQDQVFGVNNAEPN